MSAATQQALEDAPVAFDGFDFPTDDMQDTRDAIRGKAITSKLLKGKDLRNLFAEIAALVAIYTEENSDAKNIMALRKLAQQLITAQKAAVQKLVEPAHKAAIEEEAQNLPIRNAAEKKANRIAFAKKVGYYSSVAVLATTGLTATVGSALMEFSPTFAVMVGVNLPVAALASIAVAGLAVTAVAAYLTYRAYKPAQQPDAVNSSEAKKSTATVEEPAEVKESRFQAVKKSLADFAANPRVVAAFNYSLIASGVGLMSFSGAMLNPKFALMVGVHLSPVALASIAAVGALLLSVALYRMYKAQTPAPATEANEDAAATKTCYQRASQFMQTLSCCGYNLFKKADASTETAGLTATNTVKVTA